MKLFVSPAHLCRYTHTYTHTHPHSALCPSALSASLCMRNEGKATEVGHLVSFVASLPTPAACPPLISAALRVACWTSCVAYINCINKFIDFNCCCWLVKYFVQRFMLPACKFVFPFSSCSCWCCCCCCLCFMVLCGFNEHVAAWKESSERRTRTRTGSGSGSAARLTIWN